MRRETGEAVLANSPALQRGRPTLSSLVGRVANSRGLAVTEIAPAAVLRSRGPLPVPPLSRPLPGLVTAPPADRSEATSEASVDGLALLGAHGGAGVSCLLRAGLDGVAVDAGRRWPRAGAVVLVARTSTSGLEWARDLARQHASGTTHAVDLLGLVLVADAPGRLPARTAALRDLVCGAFARTWHLPWLEEWRVAAATEPLPLHPAVQQLAAELARMPALSQRLSHTPRPGGDLL